MKQVAGRVGVAERTLYLAYASKATLLNELIVRPRYAATNSNRALHPCRTSPTLRVLAQRTKRSRSTSTPPRSSMREPASYSSSANKPPQRTRSSGRSQTPAPARPSDTAAPSPTTLQTTASSDPASRLNTPQTSSTPSATSRPTTCSPHDADGASVSTERGSTTHSPRPSPPTLRCRGLLADDQWNRSGRHARDNRLGIALPSSLGLAGSAVRRPSELVAGRDHLAPAPCDAPSPRSATTHADNVDESEALQEISGLLRGQ